MTFYKIDKKSVRSELLDNKPETDLRGSSKSVWWFGSSFYVIRVTCFVSCEEQQMDALRDGPNNQSPVKMMSTGRV